MLRYEARDICSSPQAGGDAPDVDGWQRQRAEDDRPLRIGDFDRFTLIVGAPRCGTTSLFHFLKANPSVASPFVKEPHFFAQHDLRALSRAELRSRVEGEYLRRFFTRDRARRIGLDASVTYLYAPEQLEPILRLWPESRFIVSLRDPATMLPSLHKRLIYNGDETIGTFEDAWAAVPARRGGRRVPRYCADPRWLFYDEPCRYFTYLQRLFSVVGPERCLVLFFDDLEADPIQQYLRLTRFAGLEAAPGIDMTAHRASHDVRLRWLQRLLKRPPHALRELIASDKFWRRFRDLDRMKERRASKAILSLRRRLLAWNEVARPPDPLPSWLEDEIRGRFKAEVDRLGSLLGQDLTHWLRPRGIRPGQAEEVRCASSREHHPSGSEIPVSAGELL